MMLIIVIVGLIIVAASQFVNPTVQHYLRDQKRFTETPIIFSTRPIDDYLGFSLTNQVPVVQAVLRSGSGTNPNVLTVQFEATKETVDAVFMQLSFTNQDNTSQVLEFWTCKTAFACPLPWLVYKESKNRKYQIVQWSRLYVYIDQLENKNQRVTFIKYIRD
jgi:hypothetical protein